MKLRTRMVSAGRTSCLAIAATLFLLQGAMRQAEAVTYTVGAGDTFELASDGTDNASGNRIEVTGDATLKLAGTATNGEFPLKLNIRFTEEATLVVDSSDIAGCAAIRMTGHVRDNSGAAKIELPAGIGSFVIGTATKGADSALSFPLLDSDIAFTDVSGRVVFTNDATVTRFPSCAWSVAEGTRIASLGSSVFAPGDFTLADYDVQVLSAETFAEDATVSVPSGRTLYVRPCVFSSSNDGTWNGTGKCLMTNRVVLGGADARLCYLNNNAAEVSLDTVSGTGAIRFQGNGNLTLAANFDYAGTLEMSVNRSAAYTLCPTNGGVVSPDVLYNGATTLYVHPGGWNSGETAARLASIGRTTGSSASLALHVAGRQTLTVGSLSGAITAIADGRYSSLVVERLAAGTQLKLQSGVALTVLAFEAGATIELEEDSSGNRDWSITGPSGSSACALPIVYAADMSGSTLAVGGNLAFDDAIPVSTLTLLSGATITAPVAVGTKVVNNGATFVQTVKTWQDKIALWTDASAANTFSYVKDEFPSATFLADNQIMEWKDCRASHQVDGAFRIRLTPFDSATIQNKNTHKQTFPFVEENDGLQSVRLAFQYGRGFVATGPRAAATVSTKFALLVFNSKNGGGNALLGTTGSKLRREAATVSAPSAAMVDDPLVYANVAGLSFRTNGVEVADPAGTKPTGGWQIIAISCAAGLDVGSICHDGTSNAGNGNGGQIYAEIMLFGEMPTESEIEAAETYLARKWNLPIGHDPVDCAVSMGLSGSGSVSLAADATVTSGVFNGTVNLNGHKLSIATGSELLPFTEKEIPSDGRVLWIDPSLAGAVVHGADAEKPLEVAYIHARDNNGLLTAATNMCVASPYSADIDMRVRTVSGSRAAGVASTWLDFSNGYANDSYRNHLQVKKDLGSDIPTSYADTATFRQIDVKAGFFALDTARGGGTLLSTTVNGKGAGFRPRGANAKIWPSDNAPQILAADTYLDGVPVDATSQTFSFCPEVMSFNFKPESAAVAVKMFGYSGTTESTSVNPEIMGEWLLFSKTLDDADRRGIEAYLMKKWLGRQLDGYSDFRDMTVVGDGVLVVDDVRHLPALSAAFTGTVELTGNTLSFTLPVNGGDAAVDAVDISGQSVALPGVVTVNVNMAGAKSGTYRLLRAGQFAGETVFALGTVAGQGNKRVELVVSDTEVAVRVHPQGFLLSIR